MPESPDATGLVLDEASRLRRDLVKTSKTCGCQSGAALSLIALIAWPALVLTVNPPDSLPRLALAVAVYALVVMASAVVGKGAGLAVGKFRHRRLSRRLAALAPAEA